LRLGEKTTGYPREYNRTEETKRKDSGRIKRRRDRRSGKKQKRGK
jgi:hypothetical protein